MLHVYFLSCKREKKTKRKGERSLTYMHVLCVGKKKRQANCAYNCTEKEKERGRVQEKDGRDI